MKQTLERGIKETNEKAHDLDKSNACNLKKLKDTTEERDKLRDKLTTAKDQIKKEREEFRTKYDKAFDDLMR